MVALGLMSSSYIVFAAEGVPTKKPTCNNYQRDNCVLEIKATVPTEIFLRFSTDVVNFGALQTLGNVSGVDWAEKNLTACVSSNVIQDARVINYDITITGLKNDGGVTSDEKFYIYAANPITDEVSAIEFQITSSSKAIAGGEPVVSGLYTSGVSKPTTSVNPVGACGSSFTNNLTFKFNLIKPSDVPRLVSGAYTGYLQISINQSESVPSSGGTQS